MKKLVLALLLLCSPAMAANTYTWTIPSLFVTPTVSTFTNVIVGVNWALNGTDGTQSCSLSGVFNLPAPTNAQPYNYNAGLTQAQVLAWIVAIVPPSAIANVQNQCNAIITSEENPNLPIVTIPSWAQSP